MLGLFELLPAYSVVNTGSIYSLQSISGDIHDYTFFLSAVSRIVPTVEGQPTS